MVLEKVKIVEIPKIKDVRGNLSVIEGSLLPFEIKRVYYLYDVPSDASRGGHAHIEQWEFLVALSGSFEVLVDDGVAQKTFLLNKPFQGLLLPNGIWRALDNFSSGSVCLVTSSGVFLEEDYIRDYQSFIQFKGLGV